MYAVAYVSKSGCLHSITTTREFATAIVNLLMHYRYSWRIFPVGGKP